MDIQTDGIIMKSRSASACIKEGYELYIRNLRNTIKNTWVIASLYSLMCSALCTILTVWLPQNILHIISSFDNVSKISIHAPYLGFIIFVLFVLGGVTEIASYSCIITLFKNRFQRTNTKRCHWLQIPDRIIFIRTLIALLSSLLIFILIAIIIYLPTYLIVGQPIITFANNISTLAIICLETILLFLLAMPLAFVDMKYILNKNTQFWKLVKTDYPIAIKHFGFIFIVILVSFILVGVIEYILSLPATILTIANYQANVGILNGDQYSMPGYITYISAIAFFVAGFIQIYIRMSVLFTSYYMYGSIETQEKEQKKFKDSTSQYPH